MRKRIYFTGASGTGKTTLADYLSRETGITKLPSPTAAALKELNTDHKALLRNVDEYVRYQATVARLQIGFESCDHSFISERTLIDIAAYSAEYGSKAWQIARLEYFQKYLLELRRTDEGRPVVFFVRPTRHVWREAKKDKRRKEFLQWDRMNKYDGMIRFVLETNEIPYVSIDTVSLCDRRKTVLSVIKSGG